jgi:predicted permease
MLHLLCQGASLPPLGLMVAICVACLGAPLLGLAIAAGLRRRPAVWRWCVAVVFSCSAIASYLMGDGDATPGKAGFVPAMSFCALMPIGLFLGAWFLFAPGRRSKSDRATHDA